MRASRLTRELQRTFCAASPSAHPSYKLAGNDKQTVNETAKGNFRGRAFNRPCLPRTKEKGGRFAPAAQGQGGA
jgi:hypothetical protein